MRAAIYVRVSSDEQAEKGYSLPTQIDACRKYANDHSFVVIEVHTDDYTGTKLDRPGLDLVRTMIERKEIDAVIVYASDRLTRKLAHLLILREEFRRTETELHYVRRGKSEDTPESRMMENIEGVFNEYWREKIIEASRRGSIGKALKGKVVGAGPSPYGYRYAKDEFTIVESEANIVRMIFQWYLRGDEGNNPITCGEIARRLSTLRVPTPGECGRAIALRKRSNGMWGENTIRNIITNETYIGNWKYGKRAGAGGYGGKRHPSEAITVKVPPIISIKEWQAAQSRRAYNSRMSKRNTHRVYLLRGMVTCECGKAMTGMTSGMTSRRYRCSSQSHYHGKGLEQRSCPARSANARKLEECAWRFCVEVMTDPERFANELRKAYEAERFSLAPKQERLSIINKLIGECESEAENLANALARVARNGIVGSALQNQIEETEKRFIALTRERQELQEALNEVQISDESFEAAMQYQRDVQAGMENATDEDKRRIFEVLRLRISVKAQKAVIRCFIPTTERVIDLVTGYIDS